MMEFSPQQEGRVLVLTPAGRVDQAHVDDFQLALAGFLPGCTAGTALLLDLSKVDFISSIGLRALMLAIRQIKAQGGRMALAALSPLVREVFSISRFDMLFEIFPDRAGALAALNPPTSSGPLDGPGGAA
ncbi:STAS domain-containing protein [Rugamonas rubra]|uniref:Anti-sigma factor antagonist n=1 Tax=Rugamonas rubra TaxID=758825 RepID=A0A1I4PIP2_9BURK|nr:STAS domain-containing protein [Rugamonas rubra]SFM27375.1 stage II sporulation protein AA (anti-sigma F factor antagonist) [Rugamonas rubra]